MLRALLLTSVLALAGVPPTSNDPVHAETTIDLTVATDDTLSGTATFHLALDEDRWDTERFGPPSDAAPSYERSPEGLERLDNQLAGHTGVTVETIQRDGATFGHSGVTVRFDTVPFERFNTVLELLQDDAEVGTMLSMSRQTGRGDAPEGGGSHHRVDGEVNPPPFEVRPDLDHTVSVSVTFAGLVYSNDGHLNDRTVTWSDEGSVSAIAATDEEGSPWQWWLLLGTVVVLSVWRYAQQGNRRERERQGEIPPPKSETDGFQPIHR